MNLHELVNDVGDRFFTYETGKPFNCIFNDKKYKVMYINYFIDLELLQLGCVLPDGVSSYRDDEGFFHTSYKLRGHNIDDIEFEGINMNQFNNVLLSIR